MMICKHPVCKFKSEETNECLKDIVILNEAAACEIWWKWRNGQMTMIDDSRLVEEEHKKFWWLDLPQEDIEEIEKI